MGEDDRRLPDLTTQMQQWQTGTGRDLALNDPQLDKFLGRLQEAKAGLEAQLAGANGLQAWLSGTNVSEFVSATTTRTHLLEDIHQFIDAVTNYTLYLDAVQLTTNAARRSIRQADQPG